MRPLNRIAWVSLAGLSGITLASAGGTHSPAMDRAWLLGLLGTHAFNWLPVLVRRLPGLRGVLVCVGALLTPVGAPLVLLLAGRHDASIGYLFGSSLGLCLAWTAGDPVGARLERPPGDGHP